MEIPDLSKPLRIEPPIACPLCNELLRYDDTLITLEYFSGSLPTCPKCGKNIDWLVAVLRAVKMEHFNFLILAPIGVQSIVVKVLLKPGQQYLLDFRKYGLPDNAKILDLNYTPDGGGLFPLEMQGNSPLRERERLVRNLYPVALLKHTSDAGDTNVNVLVSWISHTAEDISWQNLVDSFIAYSEGNFNRAIIPANVAIESKLAQLMDNVLQRFAAKRTVEDFLKDAATYSHQLNVLLPLIAHILKVPMLPEKIRGQLNRLRGHRHKLAHEGKLFSPLTREDIAELIVAALFSFHYLRLVEDSVSKRFSA